MRQLLFLIILISVLSLLLIGLEVHAQPDSTAGTTELTNEMCPVMPDEPVDPTIFAMYDGQKVYFCCQRCRKEFLANPTEYVPNLPQFAKATGTAALDPDEESPDSISAPEETQIQTKTPTTTLERAIEYAGRFHPVVVHFPIVLLLLAALTEFLFMRSGHHFYADSTRFSLNLSLIATIITVVLGWADGAFANHVGEYAAVLDVHRWIGTGTGLFVIATWILGRSAAQQDNEHLTKFYRLLLFTSVILVMVTAHFGAALIYGLEYFTAGF